MHTSSETIACEFEVSVSEYIKSLRHIDSLDAGVTGNVERAHGKWSLLENQRDIDRTGFIAYLRCMYGK